MVSKFFILFVTLILAGDNVLAQSPSITPSSDGGVCSGHNGPIPECSSVYPCGYQGTECTSIYPCACVQPSKCGGSTVADCTSIYPCYTVVGCTTTYLATCASSGNYEC